MNVINRCPFCDGYTDTSGFHHMSNCITQQNNWQHNYLYTAVSVDRLVIQRDEARAWAIKMRRERDAARQQLEQLASEMRILISLGDDAIDERDEYKAALQDGIEVVNQGVALMECDTLGNWSGVRAWLEQAWALLDDNTRYTSSTEHTA